MKNKASIDQQLFEKILSFKYDPISFVRYVYPWGQVGTPLERFSGPRTWQIEELEKIKYHLDVNRQRITQGLDPKPYYLACSSGRGTGKSAWLTGQIAYWMMSCWLGGTCIVTANTEDQLRSRTLAELGKWHQLAINKHWFDKKTLSLRPQKWFGLLLKDQLKIDTQYFYVEGQNWSEENPDAFAGAHSQTAMVLLYDEASGIPDPIWDVSEGFFTDLAELRLWIAISNPRRNVGQFYQCFHKDSDFWNTRYIDSRTVEGVDSATYQRIADKYGEDDDVTRVEVKGEFPRHSSAQFISREVVEDAQIRELAKDDGAPLLMGVDVARGGQDQSVIRFRQGRDARSFPVYRFKISDTMRLSTEVANLIDRFNPDAVFVDGGGVGGGVVDRLKQLRYRIIEVQFGSGADNKEKYKNKRTEIWGRMREWLLTGCIDEDSDLLLDLTGPEYEVMDVTHQLKLQSKDKMTKSPDDADALAITFATNIARNDTRRVRRHMTANIEYDVFGG